MHDDHRLVVRERSLLLHEAFHRACLCRRDVLIGVGHAPEEIRERREDAGTVRLEVIQGIERLTQQARSPALDLSVFPTMREWTSWA